MSHALAIHGSRVDPATTSLALLAIPELDELD
jgi:hypothetical protein